jgi:hypothetical protein
MDTTTIPNNRFYLSFHLCYYHHSLLTCLDRTQRHCLMRHHHQWPSISVMLNIIFIPNVCHYGKQQNPCFCQGFNPHHSIPQPAVNFWINFSFYCPTYSYARNTWLRRPSVRLNGSWQDQKVNCESTVTHCTGSTFIKQSSIAQQRSEWSNGQYSNTNEGLEKKRGVSLWQYCKTGPSAAYIHTVAMLQHTTNKRINGSSCSGCSTNTATILRLLHILKKTFSLGSKHYSWIKKELLSK